MEFTVVPVRPTTSDGEALKVLPVAKHGSKDRRRRKQDRRKNVREGIFVSLSNKEDRRRPGDRRRVAP